MTQAVPSTSQPSGWSCLNGIQNQMHSVCEKIRGLCSTDCKIYTFLILGRVLQTAAIAACIFTIGFTFVAGPAALLGLVPSIAMGILGTWVAGNGGKITEMLYLDAPFVPGQPIGLSNTGSNCWINSGCQILANIPAFQARLRQIPEFAAFLSAYNAARTGHLKVAPNIDTHQIRQFLSRETNGQISAGYEQEDAAQLFEYLFQGRNSLYTFDQQLNGLPAAARLEPMVQLQIDRGAPMPPFDHLLNNFFNFVTDIGQRGQLFFQRAPDDMLIQCKRFYQDQGVLGKINDPLEIPERFRLPAQYVRSGEHPVYDCDAFLVHMGSSPHVGHYVSYIKTGNTWWYCSDSTVYAVSADQVKEAMKHSYILHFAKSQLP